MASINSNSSGSVSRDSGSVSGRAPARAMIGFTRKNTRIAPAIIGAR
jgi:hypothetical protein